ncbi:MAG: DEAD/DEAH box helicase [Chloroflexi bacterium]|nr:MAG: DEAD/DEAH box helicase [Chloroflexota bacterium]
MSIEMALDRLLVQDEFRRQLTLDHTLPARQARYAAFPEALDYRLGQALAARGITRLYTHQAEATRLALAGKDVVVVTPTASGKTVCYNLPVLQALLKDREARALYLFPTKALAQDQLAELHGLVGELKVDLKTYTYDGDTPVSARQAIRQAGHIVVTNPDMLHTGVLPHHTRWVKLFANLKYVVIDELHAYRGVFGSHLANVLRRLWRVCAFYDSHPVVVCCSATIANPKELAERLSGRPMSLVDNNGAPTGPKRLLFYNPPVINRELGIRRSSTLESQRIAETFLRAGVQTIVFGRTRLQVEILLSYLQQSLGNRLGNSHAIRGYRGGYLPLQRREIEHGLRDGSVRGVVSTNALELGIDIGHLDAAILCGYPGTIASTWQQVGRAGRRRGVAAAVFIASSSPLDQYLVNHPEYFLGRDPEQGLIDPDNLLILSAHLQAATFELPLSSGEPFGQAPVAELLRILEEDGAVHQAGDAWHWSADAFPAEGVSLRSANADNVVIVDLTRGARVVGEMDQFSAPVFLHEEAIYLHEGMQYHVDRLDWDEKKAYVRPVKVDYYTDANLAVSIKVLETFASATATELGVHHGEVRVTALPTVFKKIRFHTHENIGSGPISLPEQQLHTTAFWLDLPPEVARRFPRPALQGGLHGMANVISQVACLFLMCDARDLGAYAETRAPHSGMPSVFVYERYPGGVGMSARLFEMTGAVLAAAHDLVSRCACESGCPSCVGPALEVGEEGKAVVLQLLELAALAPAS